MTKTPFGESIYRGYEGELASPGSRWWVISRQLLSFVFKKRAYWVLTILSGIYYLLIIAVTYFIGNFGAQMGGGEGASRIEQEFYSRIIWEDQFLHGFQFGHFLMMAIVLIVGAGAIANDNNANALLVYLSKTCSRFDYLLGKWLGVFIAISLSMFIPAVFFFVYGSLNFRENGFLSDDASMFWSVPLSILLGSAFQTTMIVGISSFFKQGRMAGATYAGLYILSGLFAFIAKLTRFNEELPDAVRELLSRFHYCSVYGVIEAGFKVLLNTNGASSLMEGGDQMVITQPPVGFWLFIYVVPSLLFLFIAYRRIRAVEVVG